MTAKKEDIAENNQTRFRRAQAWLNQAKIWRKECEAACKGEAKDRLLCAEFVSLWIAFDALYERKFYPPQKKKGVIKNSTGAECIRFFFQYFESKCESQEHLLKNELEKLATDEIESLITLDKAYGDFWVHGNPTPSGRNKEIRGSIRQRPINALRLIFERIYVVRNQVFHGAHTIGGSWGKKQIELSTAILRIVVPIIKRMMEESKADWEASHFPRIIEKADGPRKMKKVMPEPNKGNFHNPAEGQDPQAREEKLLADLPAFVAFAKEKCEAYRQRLADINPANINSRDALAELPTTEKSSLISEQERCPPFGGYLPDDANPIRQYLSPGPIAEVDDDSPDYWKTASPLFAAGFRYGDLIHNCFSYHFTPAGMMCESGARALGCRVFAGGVGNSEQQARALARFHPRGYCGTPDFLGVILDKAEEINADASSLKIASVSGGPLTDAMRKNYNARGVYVLQWFGTAELGCAAFEGAPGGGMVVSEKTLIEIVHPVTKKPLAAGEKGELLITNFNRLYPLIRFATGDLSAVVAGQSPCGRTNMRIAGWLGRSDQSVKVRGMFVHPIQIERIASRFAEIKKAQLIIDSVGGRDEMILHCNLSPQTAAAESLAQKIAEAMQAETKLRGEVKITESIDGEKLIKDKRKG